MTPKLILYPQMGLSFKDKKLIKDNLFDEEEFRNMIKWEHRMEIYNEREANYLSEVMETYGLRIYTSHPYYLKD